MMINVLFEGGESRQNHDLGCNYMIAHAEDSEGNDVELYSEVLVPDDWQEYEEIPDGERERFDQESFEELKADIIRQAKEAGIEVQNLSF